MKILLALILSAFTSFGATIYQINVGTAANDGTGDTLRSGFQKSNTNFANLNTAISNITAGSSQATNYTTTNATKFGLFDQNVGGVLRFFGIEQGTNVVLYRNGSNVVFNANPGSGGSGSVTTNANQFGASTDLTLKDGVSLTNQIVNLRSNSLPSVAGGGYLTNRANHYFVETNASHILSNIIAATSSGDVVELGAGVFNLGTATLVLPHGVSLIGQGPFSTFISGTASLFTNGPIVVPSSGSRVSDLAIVLTNSGAVYQAGYGFYSGIGQRGPTNALFENFRILNGQSDGIYLQASNYHSGIIRNGVIESKWDAYVQDGANVVSSNNWDMFHLKVTSDFNGATFPAAISAAKASPIRVSNGILRMFGCDITATNAPTTIAISSQGGSIQATGQVSLSGLQVANETVNINGTVYTFKGSVGATANEVLIGVSATATAANLSAAINQGAGAGTVYGSATVAHTTVSASAASGVVTITAISYGTVGNLYTLAESASNTTVSGATLSGGWDAGAIYVYGGSFRSAGTNASKLADNFDNSYGPNTAPIFIQGASINDADMTTSSSGSYFNNSFSNVTAKGTLTVVGNSTQGNIDAASLSTTGTADIGTGLSSLTMTLFGLTASRALGLNAFGDVTNSATTFTELGYLSGVGGAIQTQLNTATNRTETKQSGNAILTNIVATGAITNLQSAGNTNATKYAVVQSGTNTTGRVKTLSAGSNITITEEGSTNLVLASTASGSSGGTNYPPVINTLGATNVTLGSGVRQHRTWTTNASFGINFSGTALNGETVRVGVSNRTASTIWWTNYQGGTVTGAFDPTVASNVTAFAVAPTSIGTWEFVWHTNFNNGAVRQEVQWRSVAEVELGAGTLANLTTNGLLVSVNVNTNFTPWSIWVTNVATMGSIQTNKDNVWMEGNLKGANASWHNSLRSDTLFVTNTTQLSGVVTLPNVSTNSILMSGGTSNVTAATIGPSMTFVGGVLAAGSVLTNLTGTVASNVTNENSTALQINSGTLTLTPGVLSNLVASTIDVSPGNIVTNVIAQKWNIWTNYVQTVSNFVFTFNTNRYELKNQTNVIFTNIVEEATAVGADMAVHIHNTTGVTMGLVWPSYGAQHGYFFQTNANNPILSTTTLTTGKHGVASFTAFGTNIFATWTEWP